MKQSCAQHRIDWGNPAPNTGLPGPRQVDGLDLATSELRESVLQLCRTTSVWSLPRHTLESVPGRNRTSETSLWRPTPKPSHHRLSLPFWRKNGLTAMSPLRHRSLWGRKVRKRLGKARPAPRLRSEQAISTEVGNPTSLTC